MQLKYNLFDIVPVAIMNKESIIIVEGKDDYQIYQNLVNILNLSAQVYQSNEFEDYEEGCKGVISCIESLQPKFEEREENINKVLGIIDRDIRQFRNELPTHLRGIFITKYYSIETYFATRDNLLRLINKITYTTKKEVDESIIDIIEDSFKNLLEDLYFISLEALKNACTKNYPSVLGYSESENKVIETGPRNYIMRQLLDKKQALKEFASINNISEEQIKLIAKGKWYLFGFAYFAYQKISELKESCRNGEIVQCRSCKVGNHNDCLFKMKQLNYRPELLRDELLSFVDMNECQDIITALSRLN